LVKGSLKAIRVTRRGVSPRIIQAVVLGTGGSTTVTGDQLARSFGLASTWICFAMTAAGTPARGWDAACRPPTLTLTAPPSATAPGAPPPAPTPTPPPSAGPTGGNAAPS
jgi:hypothetical protein